MIQILKLKLGMPVKNGGLKNGDRINIIDRSLWKRFQEKYGLELPYNQFVTIIKASSARIKDKVTNNVNGFKLPETMGYQAVTRYKNKNKYIVDWGSTTKEGTTIYYTNFHSSGYQARIVWLTDRLSNCKYVNIYKFVPDRLFVRGISDSIKKGKIYNEHTYAEFKSKMIRINIDKLLKKITGGSSI